MNGPMIHSRTLDVQRAHLEMASALLDLEVKHDLTYGEMVAFHGAELQRLAKYMLRAERHPGEDKAADEA